MIILEELLNRTLALDAGAAAHLDKLCGKCVEIQISNIEKSFFVVFVSPGLLRFARNDEKEPHATIRGPLKAFVNFALTKNAHLATRLGLSFEGDSEVLENIQQLFLSLDIDWEEALSHWTGDIFAHQLGTFARNTQKRHTKLFKHTQESIAEYLKEESGILPTRPEVEYFMDEVDALRSDVERLATRLGGLE